MQFEVRGYCFDSVSKEERRLIILTKVNRHIQGALENKFVSTEFKSVIRNHIFGAHIHSLPSLLSKGIENKASDVELSFLLSQLPLVDQMPETQRLKALELILL